MQRACIYKMCFCQRKQVFIAKFSISMQLTVCGCHGESGVIAVVNAGAVNSFVVESNW